MSSFPTSVPAFTTYADNVDFVLAAHQNTPNGEINAIATLIGALGLPQSQSVDLVDMLANLFKPTLKISYTSSTTLTVSTGRVACQKSDASQRVFRKNTSTTAITGANLDASGPTFAVSTTYYVFANADAVATTVTFKISTSATTPAGVTCLALIGGFGTDSSGNVISGSEWSVAGLRVINFKSVSLSTKTDAATLMIDDNTKPQNTEGVEIMTLPYTPQAAANILIIEAVIYIGGGSSGTTVAAAIFRDTTADAIFGACGGGTAPGNQSDDCLVYLRFLTTAGDLATRTYKLRCGPFSGGNTIYINGMHSNTGLFNGVNISSLSVTELEV